MSLLPLPILFVLAFAIALPVNYPELGGPAEASRLPRRQRRHGLDHDLRRRHLHRGADRHEDDRGHGGRRRVGHPGKPGRLATGDRGGDEHAAQPRLHAGRLLLRRDAGAGAGRGQLRHRSRLIGRGAILGQMTTGFPLSPLTASTFILIGLSGVNLGDHQRFIFPWAFGTTLVMTAVAYATGAL